MNNKHWGLKRMALTVKNGWALWSRATGLVLAGCLVVGWSGQAAATSKTAGGGKLAAANANATLTYASSIPIVTFDPLQSESGGEQGLAMGLVYDNLVQLNNKAQAVPDLATSWQFQSATEITFKLRSGVTYEDGSPFNATTAKASLDWTLAADQARVATLQPITKVEAVNPTTLRIYLKAPDPTILESLTQQECSMVSPSALTRPNLNFNPDGTGAYFYDPTRSTPGTEYTFTANPHWWGRKKQIRPHTIVFKVITTATARLNALQTGQVDVAMVSPTEANQAKADGLHIQSAPTAWYGLLITDRQGKLVPGFANPKVRQAMEFELNRSAIVRAAFDGYGTASVQPLGKGQEGYDPALEKKFVYNVKKARLLMAQSGVHAVSFTAPFGPTQQTEAEIIKAELAAIGITMNIQIVPHTSLAAAGESTKYPVITFAYPNVTVYARYLAQIAPGAVFNPFKADDPTLDQLATEFAADAATKPAAARKVAMQMSDQEVSQGYYVVAAQGDTIVASKNNVAGIGVVYLAPTFYNVHFKG